MQEQTDAFDTSVTQRRSRRVRGPRERIASAKYVYVIEGSGEECKVGVTSNIRRRRSQLQVSTPGKLDVSFWSRPESMTAYEVESAVKSIMKPWRVSGEWFSGGPGLLQVAIMGVQTDRDRLERFLQLWAELRERQRKWEAADKASIISRKERESKDAQKLASAAESTARYFWRDFEREIHRDFPNEVEMADPRFGHRFGDRL